MSFFTRLPIRLQVAWVRLQIAREDILRIWHDSDYSLRATLHELKSERDKRRAERKLPQSPKQDESWGI